ncbi:aminotransferase class IV [Motiliproteus sediminis]|uniref:aminotransferase class IV n=1 Tax=Motiliproteus sediminis TaxID=1468178 RepID=UPI001AEF448F|nr:aminotransferase class IV [Motiliproteus sediminis]
MSETVFLNGAYLPRERALVSAFDRGFLFADAVYEVIPFYAGKGFRLVEHVERLQRSLRAVAIADRLDWAALCEELVARNGGGDQAVYLQVTRGCEAQRNHRYSEGLEPTVFAYCYAIPAALEGDPERVAGITATLIDDIRWQRCDIKSTALLANVMMLQQALTAGAQEAILVRDGLLTEGSACNVLIVEQGGIVTPANGPFILGGTTRDLVLELATADGICCREEAVAVERVKCADEIWITSSTRGIVPVLRLDDQLVGTGRKGPLWARVANLYRQFEQQVRQA